MKAIFSRRLVGVVLLAICGALLFPPHISAQPQKDLALTLVSNSYYVDVRAGRETRFSLEVRNTGRVLVTEIALSSDPPEGWTVTFDRAQIGGIDQDGVATVNVSIRPPAATPKGEYPVRFTATSGDIRTVQVVPVRVASASYWLWVGVGATAVVIVAFIAIFLRMGRRG